VTKKQSFYDYGYCRYTDHCMTLWAKFKMVSHDRVIIDGFWIGTQIYWTIIQLTTALHKSLSYKNMCSRSRSSLHCLVTSSNSGCSSASRLTSSQGGDHFPPTSYSSNCHLVVRVRVRLRVTLRLAVYRQSVCLGAKPLETHCQNYFSI
jgi:hypothetical protein